MVLHPKRWSAGTAVFEASSCRAGAGRRYPLELFARKLLQELSGTGGKEAAAAAILNRKQRRKTVRDIHNLKANGRHWPA